MSTGDFETPHLKLRYNTGRPWNNPGLPARWEVMVDGLKVEAIDDGRALEIAELFGLREKALQAMAAEAKRLRERANQRLHDSHDARARAEETAVQERREADRIKAFVKRASLSPTTAQSSETGGAS